MSTRLDRIKGAVVRSVVGALVGNTARNHLNPAIQQKKQTYTPQANRIFHPVNELIQNTLKIVNHIEYNSLTQSQADQLRDSLHSSLVSPSDSVTVANLKLDQVNATRKYLVNMVKSNKARANSARSGEPMEAKLSGRGAYTWRNFGRDAFTGVGTALGGIAGGAAGTALNAGIIGPRTVHAATVGGALGGGIGTEIGNSIFGRGAYTVARNTIVKTGMVLGEGTEVPSFVDSNRFTRITHREFIQDIVVPGTPTTFTNTTFVINPGNATLFPWLATIASCYQQYEIMGMVFMFKSTSTDFSTSGALGSVVLATNYDVLESPYASKVIMENSQYAVSAKPSLSQMHAIECDPRLTSNNVKYIRNPSSSTTTSQDARFYDHGLFELATVGLSATAGTVLGELWVTYDIKLLKPEIVNSAFLLTGQRISSGGTVSKTNIFGTAPTGAGAIYATVAGNVITFVRPGQFLLEFENGGTAPADPSEAAVGLTFSQPSSIVGAAAMANIYLVNVTATGQTLSLDYTSSTTITLTVLRISSYSSSTS
jgi:uncharacterized protein YcfJ